MDQQDLVARAGRGLAKKGKGPKAAKILGERDLSEMFGIEMAQPAKPRTAAVRKKRALPVEPVTPPKPAAQTPAKSAAKREAISKRMKEYWHARRSRQGKTPR